MGLDESYLDSLVVAAVCRSSGRVPVKLDRSESFGRSLIIQDIIGLLDAAIEVQGCVSIVYRGRDIPFGQFTLERRNGRRGWRDDACRQLLKAGATLVLNDVFEIWPDVSIIVDKLTRVTGGKISANCYITDTPVPGLGWHADAHDVFALQVCGRKQWDLAERGETEVIRDGELSDVGTRRELLQFGEVLFVPGGWPHSVTCPVGESSLHISFGVLK